LSAIRYDSATGDTGAIVGPPYKKTRRKCGAPVWGRGVEIKEAGQLAAQGRCPH
jgi:hypothetical protein